MGASSSSPSGLLDEPQSSSIREQAEVELRDFVPYYRKQMSAARFSELENELEPERRHTPRLRHKESPQAQVLYEGSGLVLDQNRKWRERYLVVRGDHRLESHEGLEGFMKGFPPVQVLVPSGGSVWTSLDLYVDQLQRSFPALGGVKEEFSGFSGFSGPRFLVFLDLPHRRDVAFSFKSQDQRDRFCRVLEDCIRHQNHDFLRRRSLEVEALVRAVRFYQQDRGRYRSESLLIGSVLRVLSNLVTERLHPQLQQDLLDRLRAPRGQRTQTWLTLLEEVHVLLDSVLLTQFSRVQQEVQDWIRTLQPSMTSDLDLIRESRRAIRSKVQASMAAAAEQLTTEKVAPHLSAMLAALMEPVSDAFQQGCRVSHDTMEGVCQSAEEDGANPKKLIARMPSANLQSCYQTLWSISDKLAPYAKVFGFSKALTLVLIDRARLDLQQLVGNMEFTFQQILLASDIVDPESSHKAKQRVLQHFDYDSSVMRKKIVQEALITITLPYVKEQLDRDYRMGLAELQLSLDSDSAPFVVVDNEYEDIIVETLIRHVAKALTDPSLEKFNLIPDPVQEKTPEPEPGTKPETVPDQESMPETGSGPEPETVPDQESMPETGSGPEPDSGPEQESVPETGSRPEPEAEPKEGSEPEPASVSEPSPEQEHRPEVEPEQGSEPEPASVSEPGPEQEHRPEVEPEPFVEPEPRAEPGPELDPGKEPEPCIEPETVPGPRPEDGPQQELGPQSETGPDPVPDPEPDPSSANAGLAPECVRAISELVVLNLFPDVVRLED